jgi:hypothetical protein
VTLEELNGEVRDAALERIRALPPANPEDHEPLERHHPRYDLILDLAQEFNLESEELLEVYQETLEHVDFMHASPPLGITDENGFSVRLIMEFVLFEHITARLESERKDTP